ncbi:MAG: phosphatidylglycerophosphatase A [Gammaproteobacteria bacterium]|nr:phosphatidylglycerophosphatase A [Gammaproteobacteria bacterium]
MKSTKKIPITYLKNPVHFISVGFGSGLLPKAPGTFGTLVAIPLYFLISHLDFWIYFLITCVVTIAGVYACSYTSKALGVHDHSGIVIDEIAGYFITMMAVPFDWLWVLLGFVLFRIFDILKPWPISWLDKNCEGGLGIMLDDVLAGIFALICLHSILYFI